MTIFNIAPTGNQVCVQLTWGAMAGNISTSDSIRCARYLGLLLRHLPLRWRRHPRLRHLRPKRRRPPSDPGFLLGDFYLSYHHKETILFTIDPYDGNLN